MQNKINYKVLCLVVIMAVGSEWEDAEPHQMLFSTSNNTRKYHKTFFAIILGLSGILTRLSARLSIGSIYEVSPVLRIRNYFLKYLLTRSSYNFLIYIHA